MVSLRWPTFGEVLRRHRRAAGLTQEQLAERAGLSPRAITALERGVSRAPRAQTLRLLADALKLSAAERAAFEAAARGQGAGAAGVPSAAWRAPSPPVFTPLAGRTRELVIVEHLLAGEGPPVLLVAGEPGIGKSRLLREAGTRAAEQGWCVLMGGCTRRGAQEPYAPLLHALASHLSERGSARLRDELDGCAWLARLLPELAASILVPAPRWNLPPEQERRLMFAAVGRFLSNIAGPAGSLLLLDDLQWAGQDALDLLTHIVHSTQTPVRVIGCYRSTEVRPDHPVSALLTDLARNGLAARTQLGPLSPQEAAQLLELLLEDDKAEATGEGIPADLALRERVVVRSGGVPYFLVSCAQALRAGALPGAGTRNEDTVPWDVAESIRQRVASLPPTARDLLGVAAVVGRVAPGALLTMVVDRPEDDVSAALEIACQAGLLVEEGDDVYQFAHDLIREVVAASLSSRRRAVLHRRVAEALERRPGEPDIAALAYHYKRSGETTKSVEYLHRAADRAWALHANVEAETYYREVVEQLEQFGRKEDAAQARERLAEVLHLVGQYDAALDALEQVVEVYRASHDDEGVARATGLIAFSHVRRGTPREGMSRLLLLLEALPHGAISPSGLAMLYARLAPTYNNSSRYVEGLTAAERAVELACSVEDTATLVRANIPRGVALFELGRRAEAFQVMSEVVPLASALGDLGSLARALFYLGAIDSERGRFASGREYFERALTACRQLGDATLLILLLCVCGQNAYWLGEWERARDYDERAAAALREIGATLAAIDPPLGLGLLDLAQGRWEQAVRTLGDVCTLATSQDRIDLLQSAQGALAEWDLLAGRFQEAHDRLRPLADGMDHAQAAFTALLPQLGWLQLESGDLDRAAALTEQAIARACAQEIGVVLVDALRIRALVALRRHHWDEAAASLHQALALGRPMPYPYAEAKALYVYGQFHQARDEPELAREKYQAALAICDRLGEGLYRPHIERALAAVDG